jgi:hypothetical protein
MTQFAKDVAKQLDRRQLRRRLLFLAAATTAVVLAVMYLRCGRGWGLGKGDGTGTGSGSAVVADAGPVRCTIRVAAHGLTVDGKPATRDQAVATCKATTGADVIVTGEARQGDWDDLRAALEAAHIAVYVRER